MLYALIVALVAINAGYLIHLDRRDKRERDERADLLQRIQAPHVAVAEHHAETAVTVPPVEVPFPMSDEEIAAQQDKDELISWMEAVENGRASLLEVPE
jgi:hypothetical protein